jgi:hypothetical protein
MISRRDSGQVSHVQGSQGTASPRIGGHLLDVASEIIQGSGSMEAFVSLSGREHMFGALNLVLAVVTMFVAVLKPGLGQSRP